MASRHYHELQLELNHRSPIIELQLLNLNEVQWQIFIDNHWKSKLGEQSD